MIIVKNRELLIPANERYIGTPQDNLTDMREFRLDRIVQNGYDLSSLTFRIDLKYPSPRKVYTFTTSTSRSGRSVVVKTQIYTASYPNAGTKTFTFNGTKWNDGSQNLDLDEIGVAITYTPNTGDTITVVTTVAEVETDTALLTSEIQDDYVVLIWEITANQINVPGTVFVSIRGTDDSGDQRYASFPGVFYVEKNVYAPKDYSGNLSELEQLENNIIAALRKVDTLYRGYDDLEAAIEDAEAWATGTRNDVPVDSSDDSYHNNAKYWNQRAERYAVGKENGTPVSSGEGYQDNAKYYSEQADLIGEKWARGTADGTPVGSGDETYHNNAKYYSEQADAIGEKWTRGTVDGVPVGSGDETYHNNAKYYAESVGAFSGEAESWARGSVNGVDVPSTNQTYHNNAKYYSEVADINGEKWTRGTAGGTAVPSTDETYHNNAKYYAEQADVIGEKWARGTENGTAVPSSDETYHNNAKYYAEQADVSGEKWARGTVDGADVTSSDETFQNNSRYYAQQAGATVSNLQTQFNQAMNAVTADSEIQNARVDVPGTAHTTLKQRLDSDYNKNAPTGEPSGSSSVSITDALVGQRIQIVAELPYSTTAVNKTITQNYTYGGTARSVGHPLFSADLANHFYGGTVNTITGKIISKYDASGNQLATPAEYDTEQYLNTFDDDAYELRTADASITIADASLYVSYIKDKRGAAAEADYTYRKLDELENGAVDVDTSVSVHGKAADAGAVGDAIVGVRGIAAGFRAALLQCFRKVAWIDQNGQDYYDELYDTLYPVPESISAVFTQGDAVIWDTSSLDDLKQYLVVTATYGDSSTAQVFDYTLSGTLTAGTSTITVSYMEKTATFSVTVTHNPAYLTAVYTQTSTVYEGDPVSILKPDLVVTYYENAQATGVVLSENSYTLSGTLTEGTSTVTVNYQGVTDTFSVTVAADPSYITAVFTQPQTTIYTDDALDTLKSNLVVTLFRRPGEAGTVLADSAYTLSGTLTEGTSVITAEYQGLTDTFNVANVVDYYNIHTWSMSSGNLVKLVGSVDPNQSDTTKYPSRMYYRADVATRRTYQVTKGKAPYYTYNQTAVPSSYYPIPVPPNANHVKITMTPAGQYIYANFPPYDPATGQYQNATATDRISWTQLTNGVLEKDITTNNGHLFMAMNSKYDSAGTSYPVEPTNMVIEFSEV